MKHASIIEQRRRREPAFDLPPRFAGVDDRRLGGRIAAIWTDDCAGGRLPDAAGFRVALGDWLPNIVWLDCDRDVVSVREAGAPITAHFGVGAGPLSTALPFGHALALAVRKSDHDALPVRFEGGFARPSAGEATLLTRGVVLPLAGVNGATACAVISWTEPLATAPSDLLRHELWQSLSGCLGNSGPEAADPMR